MPPINLAFYVNQGRYGITANNNFNFGTTGLATCVGVIMQLGNGHNLCGHMDHTYEPTMAQRAVFEAAVTAQMIAAVPAGVAVNAVHYSTPGGTRAAQFTVAAIVAWFPGAVNAGADQSIYIDGAGVHGTNANVVNGATLVDNGAFTV